MQHICTAARLHEALGARGEAPHAAYLKTFCGTAQGDLLIHVMEQALPGGSGAPLAQSGGRAVCGSHRLVVSVRLQGLRAACTLADGPDVALVSSKQSIEHALAARAALLKPGADPLDTEVEQRLLALLGDRAVPLLLRHLQKWYSGARRLAQPLVLLAGLHCSSPVQGDMQQARMCNKHSICFCTQASPACTLAHITCAPFCPGMSLIDWHLYIHVPAAMWSLARNKWVVSPQQPLCLGVRHCADRCRCCLRTCSKLICFRSAITQPCCINAGQRQYLDIHPIGLCSSILGELLMCREICKRVPGRERIRSMRYLYTMLQWASQRIAEMVRARVEHTPHVPRAGFHAILRTSVCARANKSVCIWAACIPSHFWSAYVRTAKLVDVGVLELIRAGWTCQATVVPPACLYLAGAVVHLLSCGVRWDHVGVCMRHRTCWAQAAPEASARGAPLGSLVTCNEIFRCLPPWSVLVRPHLVAPDRVHACRHVGSLPSAVYLAANAWPAQDDMKASCKDAERREGLLPLALAAAEAAVRRAPDIMGVDVNVSAQARSCFGSMSGALTAVRTGAHLAA
jgi:hypothetical protein